MRLVLLPAIMAMSSSAAFADISVEFRESAPKDSFVIRNTASCATEAMTLILDLAPSASGLVFDTQQGGAGVEVFQPLEIITSAELIRAQSGVKDGGTALSFDLNPIAPDQAFIFTIDLDDSLPNSALGQIQVTGAEIRGATVSMKSQATEASQAGEASQARETRTAEFGDDAQAILRTPSC